MMKKIIFLSKKNQAELERVGIYTAELTSWPGINTLRR